jgi:hypothetical protein
MIFFHNRPPGSDYPSEAQQSAEKAGDSRKDDLRKDLAKAESEIAAMHVAEQQARIESINAQLTSDIDTVPVMGDMAAMMKPDIQPIKGVPRLDEPDAFEIRGYLDADGNATPDGELFLELQDSGIFDEYGDLTLKGKAFAMSPDKSPDAPLELYKIRAKAGLEDAEDITFSGALASVGTYLADSIKGAGTALFALDNDEAELASGAAILGAVKSQALLGAGIKRASEKFWLDSAEDEDAYYLSHQEFKRDSRDLNEMTEAQLVGGLMGSAEVLADMETSRQEMIAKIGPERAAQIEKEAEAFGGLFLDPSNALSFGAGFFASKAAQGPTLFAKLSQTVEKAAVLKTQAAAAKTTMVAAESTFKATSRMAELATKQADRLASIGDDAAAQKLRNMANRQGARSFAARTTADRLAIEVASKTKAAEAIALKAGGAEVITRTMQAAQQAKAMPFEQIARLTDFVGNSIIKLDEGLSNTIARIGMSRESQKMLKYMTASAGLATNPALALIPATLAAGPTLKGVANLSRIIGKEALQARGTIPFWRRVSQNSASGPLARSVSHLMDELTLGGKALAPIRGAQVVAKGTAASLPMDLGFEVLAAGGELDGNSFKQALAESLVFGGTGAAFGAVVRGNLDQKRRQQAGDEINFRSTLEDAQKARFMTLGQGARRTIGTFSAMYPSLNFQLTDSGASSYSRETNTATINVKQSDWIKPLVAHEVNHYIAARAQMEDGISALLVGPEGVGGLLRGRDGTLDANFKAAMDAYNARVRRDGNPALTPEQFAVEYFNEATVDDLVGMVDSGEMQTMAARTDTERVLREMVGSLISKTPILGDLFVKLGGAYDKGGNMVQGNGLLAGGVRELPGAKKLLRQMVQKQAGRRNMEIDPSMTEKGASKEKGVVLPEEMVKNGPIADALISQFEFDDNGKAKRDADGNPIPIDRATEIKREMAGKIIIELQKERIRRGEQMPEGTLELQEDGNWVGTAFDDAQLKALAESGIFNAEQIRTLGLLNADAGSRKGSTFAMVYQPALARGKNGKVKYAAIAPTFREVVPVQVKITKAGNILIQTMSVTQLMENIRERSKTKLGKKLYNGDQTTMLRDVEAMLALHKKKKETLPYFKEKYGDDVGMAYRNFLNTLFGLMTKEQQGINPMFETEGVKYSSNVFKSRRLDRINHTARLVGRPALPFGYDQVKANLFPVGVPVEGPNRTHLDSLENLLARAKGYLAEAKPAERRSREVKVSQLEKEIRDERKFLGLPEVEDAISDEELLAELTGNPVGVPVFADELPMPGTRDFAAERRSELAALAADVDVEASDPTPGLTFNEITSQKLPLFAKRGEGRSKQLKALGYRRFGDFFIHPQSLPLQP